MNTNPFSQLLHSRKFWLAILDALMSTIATVLGLIYAPEKAGIILGVIAMWQPVILAVIYSYTVQNVEGIKQDGEIAVSSMYATPVPEEPQK